MNTVRNLLYKEKSNYVLDENIDNKMRSHSGFSFTFHLIMYSIYSTVVEQLTVQKIRSGGLGRGRGERIQVYCTDRQRFVSQLMFFDHHVSA